MNNQKIHIAYISSEKKISLNSWSGTHAHIIRQIMNIGFTLTIIPAKSTFLPFKRLIRKVTFLLPIKKYIFNFSENLSQKYSNYYTEKIEKIHPDFIISVSAFTEIANLRSKQPVIIIIDAILPQILNYNTQLANLRPKVLTESISTEKKALSNASLIVCSSDWARKSVIETYNIHPTKARTLYFGPNIEPPSKITFTPPTKIKLLFVGVNWKRKGGDIVIDTLKIIEKTNAVELIIIGSKPQHQFKNENITVYKRLNKSIPEEYELIQKIYNESTFLILPTQADCSPIVINEALSFGIPVLTTNVGGIPEIIKNDINGYCFDKTATGNDYSEKILDIVNNKRLERMSFNARKTYDDQCNWNQFGDQLSNFIKERVP